ncbi:MAG: hypothetical protein ABIC36_02170 [bacterium]
MTKPERLLSSFLNSVELSNLSEYEQYLYYRCIEFERFRFQHKKKWTEKTFPNSNWGLFTFKPPRASSYLKMELQEKFFMLIKQKNLSCLGSYEIILTKRHINIMYPGDKTMPYWDDLERKLLNLPATYFLVISPEQKDIHHDIEKIKGWYKTDETRGRLTGSMGLRAMFRQMVEIHERHFEETILGSDKYEDSGIHAPCSITSRFLQLIGFIAIDANGARWIRSCLPWLSK